jgi:hypothetical protein
MQSKFINHSNNSFLAGGNAASQSTYSTPSVLQASNSNSVQLTYSHSVEKQKIYVFAVSFAGRMDMYSSADLVAKYLNLHEGWFCRCAQPMKVEPLGNDGYVLTVGKYGSFGYEVEPKMGVVLNPPVGRTYKMHSIPIPNYNAPGYDVNYQASMELTEVAIDGQNACKSGLFVKRQVLPDHITQVNWTLDLAVEVEFPQFMTKLSSSLIQSTGDRLLGQIVRQVSPRLTYKVQADFHSSHGLLMPSKSSRQINKLNKFQEYAV